MRVLRHRERLSARGGSPSPRPRYRGIRGLALLCCSLLLPAGVPAGETIRHVYRFEDPQVVKVKGFKRLRVPGLPCRAEGPGAPLLPWRAVRILLPLGTTTGYVSVRPGGAQVLDGRYLLEPGQPEHSPIDGAVPDRAVPEPAIYEAPGPYPERCFVNRGVGVKHGRRIQLLSLSPLRYYPRTREVVFFRSIEVEVEARPLSEGRALASAGATLPLNGRRSESIAGLVDNPTRRKSRAMMGDDTVAYAIVTSAELAPAFEPLADARSLGGLPAEIVPMEWIRDNYDGSRPDGGHDDATRLRNFIIDYYSNRGLEYVLLGGDADGSEDCDECEEAIVPTRYLQSRALFTDPVPSDLYFGCLDGSFDGDGDGIYGEPSDGEDGGDVDFLFEVHVGRAPVDSLEEADNFVQKTLAYAKGGGSVRREVLLVGEYLGFGGDYDWGGNLSDQIRSGSHRFIESVGFENSPARAFFKVRTLYDRDTLSGRWRPETLVEILQRGVHLVNHVGHADISNVMKLTRADIDALDGPHHFLVYTQSCYAGAFDNRATHGGYGRDSVVEHFLAGPAGAAALIANSRRGWAGSRVADGPSQRFNRRFWDAALAGGALQWGLANDRSKEASLDDIHTNDRARACAFSLNTLGDPALTIRLATSRGSLSLDREFYNPGAEVTITVVDLDLDLSGEELDRAPVTVRSVSGGDEETVELLERGVASGIFRGSITLETGAPAADGLLQLSPPDSVIVSYEDADDGSGAARTIEARAEAVDPVRLVGPCPPDGAVGVPYRGGLEPAGGLAPYLVRSEKGYVEELLEPHFEGIGVPRHWDADQGAWTYALPFDFPFYGQLYSAVQVSADGYLELGNGDALDFANSVEKLIANTRIAPLWSDLTTYEAGDIFIDEKLDSVTVRWSAEEYGSEDLSDFEVELFIDGKIRFGYGPGNKGLSPTIGISAGDGLRYVVSSLNGSEDLHHAPSAVFFPSRLPGGLSLDPSSGVISGVPEEPFSGEVAFEIVDSLGQIGDRLCRIDIRPDGLAVDEPRGGDLLAMGGAATIRWAWFGNIGTNIRIDYNTDGSETDFPHVIADSLPLSARSHGWSTPDLPGAPLPARIRIQSLEQPQFFTWSDVFYLVGPTIVLLSPRGGDTWVVGGEAVVEWRAVGDVGARLRVDYNVTGSEDSFPLVLAEDVPSGAVSGGGEVRLSVPPTPSESCRLRLTSLSQQDVVAVGADTFAIRVPSIALTSPNGGECLRAGQAALVTWSSQGYTGDHVLLEYNTDGSPDDFPFQASAGPLPNTGSAEWIVPAASAARSRLRIRSVEVPELADTSDAAFSIEQRCAIRALIWVPFIPVDEEQVTGALQSIASEEPDFESVFSTQTTPEALRAEMAGADALVIPTQKRGYNADFAGIGRRLGPVLREFVGRGGAAVVCQQRPFSELFLEATGLLSAQRAGEGTLLCEVAQPAHPIVRDVRPNFAGPPSTAWYEIGGAEIDRLVTMGDGYTVVASRQLGFGRLALVGFDYYSFNADTARILANAVRVDLPDAGIRLLSPDPGRSFRTGEEIAIQWFALGEARGPVSLWYSTRSAGAPCPESDPCLIAEAESEADGRGAYSWSAPDPPADGGFLEAFVEVRSVQSPAHSHVSPGPIYVNRPLRIDTTELPEGNVGLSYESLVHASGGVPPYTFQASNLPAGLIAEPEGERSLRIAGIPTRECLNCEISVAVVDATGESAQAFLPLPVVRREISIISPNGGELLLFGGTHSILWQTKGYVGETVTLSYNTTGSLDPGSFVNMIASNVPVDQPFVWQVPAITAERCRLRVESDQFPQFFDTSEGLFSIVGPTIRLVVPNGGECWEPDRRRRITWQSVGNDAGTVRIEYSADGVGGEFRPVASGLPNSGQFLWTVPGTLSDDCRVRILFENAPEIEDMSDEAFSIGEGCALSVLHWIPCPGSETNDRNMRDALRDRVEAIDLPVLETRDSRLLAQNLAFGRNRDAVVVSLISVCRTLDYEALGREVMPLFEDFVENGGVVVFCAPGALTSRLLAGLGLLDRLNLVTSRAGLPCEVVSYLHPVTRSVPLEFSGTFSTSSYRFVESDFQPLVESSGDTVVAALEQGLGRWIVLGFNYQVRDAENTVSEEILARSVRPLSIADGLRILSPRPYRVYNAGDPVAVEWAARGLASGWVRLEYNTDGSTEIFPLEIGTVEGEVDGGSFLWTAPQPPAGDYSTCRVKVSSTEPPSLEAHSAEVFYVTESPLEIATLALPDGYHGAEYSAEVRVSGGAPPYTFETFNLPAGLFLPSPDGEAPASMLAGAPLETTTDRLVTLRVTDATGIWREQTYRMNILPSRIELLSPIGGEYLLSGGLHEVTWQIAGDVGSTVSIRYNIDGNSRDFPELVVEEARADEPFLWEIPADLRSDRCRIQVVAEKGQQSVSPRTFAISGPGITCLFPNGGEVLETETPRTIRWRSLGNPGGLVSIELLLENHPDESPLAIADEAPDTGTFVWRVPVVGGPCRIRIQSVASPELTDVSDGLFGIRFERDVRGLVWIPYSSFDEMEVRGAIAAITVYENDFDWYLSYSRNADEIRSQLWGKESFIMAQQIAEPDVNFRARGRALGPVIREFVERGGTFVVLKQVGGARDFLPATGLLDATEVGGGFDVPCRVESVDHPVVNQVPPTFSSLAATGWYEIGEHDPAAPVDVYATTAEGHPVVLGRDIGDGRVVLVGFDYSNYTPASARVLANATRMTRALEERPYFVRGDANADSRIDIADAIFILGYLFRGGPEPPCLDAADADDSAEVGPRSWSAVNLGDPVHLLQWIFVGGRPPPPPTRTGPSAFADSCGPDPQFRDRLGCDSYPPCS